MPDNDVVHAAHQDAIIQQLITYMQSDANVRVIELNGSRANPNAPKDFLRDYDVCCFVKDIEAARQRYQPDWGWMAAFGKLVICQQNDAESDDSAWFVFLMQFDDSLRIDLSFDSLDNLTENGSGDSLSVILYDPDRMVRNQKPPDESDYFVKKPTQQQWDETLNELWWIQVCIAKSLWRDELPLAMVQYHEYLIDPLHDLLSWYIAIQHEWRINTGKGGKWFKRLLEGALYDTLMGLYPSAAPDDVWEKLLQVGGLIRRVGMPLAVKLHYEYPTGYDENVTAFLPRLRALPVDAEGMSGARK